MASTPYGYKIEMGKAVIDTEAVSRIETFFAQYLGGLSIKEANRIADIPLSQSSVIKLMKNEIYLGTDYYPPLITAEVFYAAKKEREKRTHPGTSVPAKPVPVNAAFVLGFLPDRSGNETAAETAALMYSMITPSEHGRTTATGSEIASLRNWAEKNNNKERSTTCQ